MGGIGKACAKLILFGEHAAVHGHTAIGVSMRETTTVRISGDPADVWILEHVPAGDREKVKAILARLE